MYRCIHGGIKRLCTTRERKPPASPSCGRSGEQEQGEMAGEVPGAVMTDDS